MWVQYAKYQIITKLLLAAIVFPILRLLNTALLSFAGMHMLTSSDFTHYFLTLPGITTAIVSFIIAGIVSGIDILAFIHISNAWRTEQRILPIRKALLQGLRSTRIYLSPSGVLVLLFLIVLVPILGLGLQSATTQALQIPTFITATIEQSVLYSAIYCAVLVALLYIALRYIFALHNAVLCNASMRQALAQSRKLTGSHTLKLIWRILKHEIGYLLICVAATALLAILSGIALIVAYTHQWISEQTGELSFAFTLVEIVAVASLMFTPWLVDLLTRLRMQLLHAQGNQQTLSTEHSVQNSAQERMQDSMQNSGQHSTQHSVKKPDETRPQQPRHRVFTATRLLVTTVLVCGTIVVNTGLSAIITNNPQDFITMRDTHVIAHRAGGNLAPENTIEGMLAAAQAGAWGCEVDAQRTKDGHYILNHDDTFKRVAGVDAKPQELTLQQIQQLRVHNLLATDDDATDDSVTSDASSDSRANGSDGTDTTSPHQPIIREANVPTVEAFLDAAEQTKLHVLLELKGATADTTMAKDLVAMIRARHMQHTVTLISLDYQLVSHIERTYSDIQTGFLYYYSFGDISQAKADMLIMEEGMGREETLDELHAEDRETAIWTVNTEDAMNRFAYSSTDAIITDYPVQALETINQAHHESTFDKLLGSLMAQIY